MQWWRAALAALSLWALAGAETRKGGSEPRKGGLEPRVAAQVERRLLQLLGLASRPTPSSVAVPDAMRDLYKHFAAGSPFLSRQQRSANTVRSYTHQESAVDDRFKSHHKFRLMFNVTVPDDEALSAAELVIARDGIGDGDGVERHKVLVYDIVKPGVKGKAPPSLRLLDSKWVRVERAGSVRLDVSSAAERWAWRPRENHGLLVRVAEARGAPAQRRHVRLRRAPTDSRESWRARQPVLLAFTDDHRGRAERAERAAAAAAPVRQPRAAARAHRRKNGHAVCQRRQLYVDFGEVGWSDWIVAPPGYEAFYCQGDCPFPMGDHLNTTNHAIVQTLVNSANPKVMAKACCVPTDLSTVSLLYTEDNKVVLKHYQDMAVVGCGCR